MKATRLFATLAAAGMLAACAQQEEPMAIAPQPVYDKFGGGSCEGSWVYVPGTTAEFDECVPPDDCQPSYAADGSVIDCPPPREREPQGRDDPGRTATGSPTAGGPRP